MISKAISTYKNLASSMKIFAMFILLSVIFATYYLVSLNPSSAQIDTMIEKFDYNEYKIPIFVAEKYIAYQRMRDFYYFLYYGFNIVSIFASVIAVTYASYPSEKDVDDKKNKAALILFTTTALLFTCLNMIINPKLIADTSQHSWSQLEQSITAIVYDTDIENNQKDKILTNKIAEIEERLESRIYSIG